MTAPIEQLRPGSHLEPWSRTTGLENWNRFAAVNDEFVDIHMSDEAGIRAGSPTGAFGMGNLRYAYIINALREWLGEDFELRSLACQFRALNLTGDILKVTGTVTKAEHESDRLVVHLDIDVLNQAGESTCPGVAVAAVRPG